MQCQVGWCFLSNSFLMYAATSFSMPYLPCSAGWTGQGENRIQHRSRRAETRCRKGLEHTARTRAVVAMSTASFCISLVMSAFLITARRISVIFVVELVRQIGLERWLDEKQESDATILILDAYNRTSSCDRNRKNRMIPAENNATSKKQLGRFASRSCANGLGLSHLIQVRSLEIPLAYRRISPTI